VRQKTRTPPRLDTVGVIGLGRVGLPLALSLAESGFQVTGVDNNPELLKTIERGGMPFLEQGADAALRRALNQTFRVTQDARAAAERCATLVLTLGTPVDEHLNPVFTQIETVLTIIAPALRPGQLLVLRSTVHPGTTEYLKRFIEAQTRLIVGKDIALAYCPERIAEGQSLTEIRQIPQIIGTLDSASLQAATRLFARLAPAVLPTDARSAELAKLFCNMYRYIDFAIANEFMMIAQAHGRHIYDILPLVNRDYKRGGLKQPGLTGGPCLYKDGFFLLGNIPYAELISTAWKINESVPAYLIEAVKAHLGPLVDKTALICGLSYKRDIDDTRNALSFKAKKILAKEGARVLLHDPLVAPGDLAGLMRGADLVFFAINHSAYQQLGATQLARWLKPQAVVCDVWNMFGQGRILFRCERPDRIVPLEGR
jgi:UDP-N-acetyl-D-mannosaminuronic acid dehydrogenase